MAHLVVVESKVTAGFTLMAEAHRLGHWTSFLAHDLAPYLRGRNLDDTPLASAHAVRTGVTTTDPAQVVRAVRELEETVDTLITQSEPHLPAVSLAAAELGLATTDPELVSLARDKYRVRQCLEAAGVPQPAYRYAVSAQQALAAADDLGYPVVAKPVDGSGSINVGVAPDPETLVGLATSIAENVHVGRAVTNRGTMLVERYVPGPVISCEMITIEGQHQLYGCTDRVLSEPPWTVELGGCFPAEFDERAVAVEVCRRALCALGIRSGLSHTEIVLGPDGPQIIEVNYRLAGGYIPEMMSFTLARNIYHDLIDLQLGRPVLPPKVGQAACIRAITAPVDGLLDELDVSALTGRDELAALVLDRQPGDVVRRPRSNRDRLGFVVALGPTPSAATAYAEALLADIRVVVRVSA